MRGFNKAGLGRRSLLAVVVAAGVSLAQPGGAQWTVFDPSNFSQNIVTAANSITNLTNQITMIENQIQQLAQGAANLVPYQAIDALEEIQSDFAQLNALVDQVEAISYNVQQMQQQFTALYPTDLSQAAALGQNYDRVQLSRAQYNTSMASYQDSLRMQSNILNALPSQAAQLAKLGTASQSANGQLGATQTGNQILQMIAQQLMQMQQLHASQYRADTLQRSQEQQSRERARQNYQTVVGSGAPVYTPSNVNIQWGNNVPGSNYTPWNNSPTPAATKPVDPWTVTPNSVQGAAFTQNPSTPPTQNTTPVPSTGNPWTPLTQQGQN